MRATGGPAPKPRSISSGHEFSLDFTVRTAARDRLIRQVRQVRQDISAAPAVFTSTADDFQRRVIVSKASTIRVIAPAGSGKTQTIANRVRTRVAGGLNPARLLILTFDNAAANSLRDRFDDQDQRLREAVRRSTRSAAGSSAITSRVTTGGSPRNGSSEATSGGSGEPSRTRTRRRMRLFRPGCATASCSTSLGC